MDKGNPQNSFSWMIKRVQEGTEKDRVQAVKKKLVEGILAKGIGAGYSSDAPPALTADKGRKARRAEGVPPAPKAGRRTRANKGTSPKERARNAKGGQE